MKDTKMEYISIFGGKVFKQMIIYTICKNCQNGCKGKQAKYNQDGLFCGEFIPKSDNHVILFCERCKTWVFPSGLRTHEVSCPLCSLYFGCDD